MEVQFGPQLRETLLDQLGAELFTAWFANVAVSADDGSTVQIGVPNLFIRDWIERRYLTELKAAVEKVFGPRAVELRVDGELYRRFRAEEARFLEHNTPDGHPAAGTQGGTTTAGIGSDGLKALGAAFPGAVTPRPGSTRPGSTRQGANLGEVRPRGLRDLNDRLTLESYVVGTCNHMAYNAGMEVLRQPGSAYNPLYVFGGSGLGKTHLLQGITRQFFVQGLRNLRYMPCEVFANRFISSIRDKTLEAFRQRFRSLDVLVLDDLHSLAKKERTQEELLHTIDAIVDGGGQVIFASDTPPMRIELEKEPLKSRLLSGLTCRVERPDATTRHAILRQEIQRRRLRLPDSVVDYIADRYSENIRDLVGALVQLEARGQLLAEPLSEARAVAILEMHSYTRRLGITLDTISQRVASHYGVTLEEMLSKARTRRISTPRQVAVYLARTLTEHSLSEIGHYFGGRSHATANFAFRQVLARMRKDPNLGEMLEKFARELQG